MGRSLSLTTFLLMGDPILDWFTIFCHADLLSLFIFQKPRPLGVVRENGFAWNSLIVALVLLSRGIRFKPQNIEQGNSSLPRHSSMGESWCFIHNLEWGSIESFLISRFLVLRFDIQENRFISQVKNIIFCILSNKSPYRGYSKATSSGRGFFIGRFTVYILWMFFVLIFLSFL